MGVVSLWKALEGTAEELSGETAGQPAKIAAHVVQRLTT